MHKHTEKEAAVENAIARKSHQSITLLKKIVRKQSTVACSKTQPQNMELQSSKTGEMLRAKGFESRILRRKDRIFFATRLRRSVGNQ